MNTLIVLVSIYFASIFIVTAFAALANFRGMRDKDAAWLIKLSLIPIVGTFTTVLLMALLFASYMTRRGER